MPIITSNPQFVNQVAGNPQLYQPYSTQQNFRGQIGEVQLWNPDADPLLIGRWLNNAYRCIVERRFWYGLLIRGQILTPQVTNTGTATVTNGSYLVQGTGTTWDISLMGQQFRIGFTNAFQTVTSVDSVAQVLTLDMPYGAQSITNTGYQIVQAWATLGGNIRCILDATNQQQGWRMQVNVPQQTLNEIDTWRQSVGWSYILSAREPTPDGQLQVEIYPTPFFLQVFPYLAYFQPPDMVADTDCPVAFIRSDVLVRMAIADALLFRGKNNKYYDPQTAQIKRQEADMELNKMERNDDCMYPQDSQWSFGHEYGPNGYGSVWNQSHATYGGW